jgi:hypothetical protein
MEIGKDKPTPMTWTLIANWILGAELLLVSIYALSSGRITSAFFMFLAAVMSLPPTASMVMGKVNYYSSYKLQSVILIVLLILSFAAIPTDYAI